MSLYNSINVKDLPSLEQILAGNYLIVENINGTNKLDFADFVIGPSNTSFYTSIANDIRSISAKEIVLSTEIDVVSTDLSKKISTLNDTVTSTVASFSPENIYYSSRLITLIDNYSATSEFFNVNSLVNKSNFNVQLDGLYNNAQNLLYPNSGFDMKYVWWYNFDPITPNTLILTISTDGKYAQHGRQFSATLSYNVNTDSSEI